jgi:hypothetical protein
MEQKETNILNIDQLLSYINNNYDHNPKLVIEVVKKALDVMIFTFGDFDSKEVFINKVTKHYQFIQGLEDKAEAPLFLTDEPKPQSEFSIKDITK